MFRLLDNTTSTVASAASMLTRSGRYLLIASITAADAASITFEIRFVSPTATMQWMPLADRAGTAIALTRTANTATVDLVAGTEIRATRTGGAVAITALVATV